MFNRLMPKNEFSKNVLTLMTGTIVAQAIPIAISPILTRIYTPEEFGLFGIFVAVSSVLGVVATARYELAIIQPRNNADVDHLTVLSLTISFFMSLISLVIVSVFNDDICQFLGNSDISTWLYFVPLSVFFMGCFQSLNYFYNRKKQYSDIAKARVVKSSGNVVVNLSAANVKINAFGLILGHVVGQLFAVIMLCRKMPKAERLFNGKIKLKKCIVLAKKYRRYPLFSSPGALLDTASLQMPILLISRFFDTAVVGYFNFTFRIVSAPMALISSALAQVLLQKIATSKPSEVYDVVIITLRKLSVTSLPILAIVFFFAEEIFAFVFSETWRVAGEYAQILIFSISIRFIVSPLSMVLALDRNIRLGMIWQVLYFISIISVLYWARAFSIKEFLIAFVVQDVFMYLLYLVLIIAASKRMKKCVV